MNFLKYFNPSLLLRLRLQFILDVGLSFQCNNFLTFTFVISREMVRLYAETCLSLGEYKFHCEIA